VPLKGITLLGALCTIAFNDQQGACCLTKTLSPLLHAKLARSLRVLGQKDIPQLLAETVPKQFLLIGKTDYQLSCPDVVIVG
jgi:hypothetical protein